MLSGGAGRVGIGIGGSVGGWKWCLSVCSEFFLVFKVDCVSGPRRVGDNKMGLLKMDMRIGDPVDDIAHVSTFVQKCT